MTGPVHNSAVYILGQDQHAPAIPPPSPPSPITPSDGPELCLPIEELSLDNDIVISKPATPSPPETPATPRSSVSDQGCTSSDAFFNDRLANAVHVLNTEATSLAFLTHLYSTDPAARTAFNAAVDIIVSRQRTTTSRGKLVIIGVGKSGHIARKLVATFNSLSIHASFMHPTEALHGDLGHIGPDDTLMLITFSGKTPELNLLMPHLDPRLPLVVLTGQQDPEAPVVTERRRQARGGQTVLLPAPVHESETASFGVSAPTTSTTMALAVGDALALTCARELNPPAVGGMAATFGRNHPGGAIGATYQAAPSSSLSSSSLSSSSSLTVRDVMVPFADITCLSSSGGGHDNTAATQVRGGDVLRAAYACKTGWVRVGEVVVSPSRIRRMTSAELALGVAQMPWLGVAPDGFFVSIGAGTRLDDAGRWLRARMMVEDGEEDLDEDVCTPESVVAVVDGAGEVVGVMEASAVLDVTSSSARGKC
ncbi:hypothetical protein VMCG_08192 [Cytospora schulzeri]|uniref:SIS domain-containing protein n=1 Tax=Cytospora schulzeri TaxID=448051 RepID=A0A423VTY2_9PEZI|nr:hypothetical protein VMCG_08192 [Valsa malicola]